MTVRRETVSAGATDFLYVSFESAGHVVMDDGANVRLVDTHPECYGGDHDLNLSAHELFLHDLASVRRHTSVIGFGYRGYLCVRFLGIPRILPEYANSFSTRKIAQDAAEPAIQPGKGDDSIRKIDRICRIFFIRDIL